MKLAIKKVLFLLLIVVSLGIMNGCSVDNEVSSTQESSVYSPGKTIVMKTVEMKETKDEAPKILDQCLELCGDGFCNEYRCLDNYDGKSWEKICNSVESSCPEDSVTCPEDC